MIKILYIVSTLENKGPTNQLFNIITNLDRMRFQPLILTLSPEKKDSQYNRFINNGIKIKSLNLTRVEGLFKLKKHLINEVNKFKPSIIHTQGIRSDILSAKYFKKNNRVSTLRNYPFDDYPMKFGKIKGKIMAIQHINSIRKINKVIACSNTVADLMEKNHNVKLDSIQNGVDTKTFAFTTKKEKYSTREKLNLPRNKSIFLSVGSLIKRKDPISIINAFRQNINNEAILIMVGDGPLRKECEEIAKNDKRIYFTGQIQNVKDYLKASDYFLSSSLSEGLPNTVLEALATGLPCCLTDIKPHKEILNLNPKAGLLFEQGNTDQLSVAIDEIQSFDYSQTSLEARSIIDKYLSATEMSKKYQKLYLNITSKR